MVVRHKAATVLTKGADTGLAVALVVAVVVTNVSLLR